MSGRSAMSIAYGLEPAGQIAVRTNKQYDRERLVVGSRPRGVRAVGSVARAVRRIASLLRGTARCPDIRVAPRAGQACEIAWLHCDDLATTTITTSSSPMSA